ncbi:hypothetical protein CC80DRAFT_176470 [Byssothecium circinans]|uniref:Mid2 domain-containing protein n=1 Tax=Byssothecium circinans TaxID=147558 RepID=A0A6A5TP08_9PLEO|nr:hypothetical protein CC80DRAFT_176470 [Byssothecium circinans]
MVVSVTMRSFILALCGVVGVWAAENTNNQFNEPDGSLDDMSQAYKIGDTLNIRWNAGWWGSDKQPDHVDLFVCWFKSDSYSDLILANTSVKQAGFFPWKINVTEAAVKADSRFVLRFRPNRDPKDYNNAGPMAPSRGFLLQLGTSSSSSTSATPTPTPTSSSSSLAVATSVSPSATPTATTLSNTTAEKSSTPVGAIVGGVVGAVAALALGVIAFLLWRRQNQTKDQDQVAAVAGSNPHEAPPSGYSEMGSSWSHDRKHGYEVEAPVPAHEMGATGSAAEEYGRREDVPVELDASERVYEAGVGEGGYRK